MKTVILGTDDDRKPIWNANFADLATTLGFTPSVCRPYRPQTKGKVERGIEFVKGNFLAGRLFSDYGDLKAAGFNLVRREKQTNSRKHRRKADQPIEGRGP
jgi:transposase